MADEERAVRVGRFGWVYSSPLVSIQSLERGKTDWESVRIVNL